VIIFRCPQGGALIQAPTYAELDAKRALHRELWHATDNQHCRADRQGVAPLRRAFVDTSAASATSKGGY
jgi:hypothetical protein